MTVKKLVKEIDPLLLPQEFSKLPIAIHPDIVTGANSKIYAIFVRGEASFSNETR